MISDLVPFAFTVRALCARTVNARFGGASRRRNGLIEKVQDLSDPQDISLLVLLVKLSQSFLTMNQPMDSTDLAQYIEDSDGISKPWLLLQLRLKKLEERRSAMDPSDYMRELEDLHGALMRMGEWWKGKENEVFNP